MSGWIGSGSVVAARRHSWSQGRCQVRGNAPDTRSRSPAMRVGRRPGASATRTRPSSTTSPTRPLACWRARSRAHSRPLVDVRATSRTRPARGQHRSASTATWSRPARNRLVTPAPPCAPSRATPSTARTDVSSDRRAGGALTSPADGSDSARTGMRRRGARPGDVGAGVSSSLRPRLSAIRPTRQDNAGPPGPNWGLLASSASPVSLRIRCPARLRRARARKQPRPGRPGPPDRSRARGRPPGRTG